MVILGLGSNVGDRLANIGLAIQLLSENVVAGVRMSPIYESEALLLADAPDNWNKPFLNMAIAGETHLDPEKLIKEIQCIERKIGRKNRGNWAPREIDIDILAWGDKSIQKSHINIPHKELCNRAFALLPVRDLEPNWCYPTEGPYKGKTAYELATKFEDDSSLKHTNLLEEILSKKLVA